MGATGQRMAGLVARVFNPKRAGKYADAMQFVAGWESAARQCERGAKTTLIDYLKIYGLKQVVPGELEKNMNRQTSTLSTYDEFKKYAMDQVALRKEPHFTGTVSSASGPRPMEVDALLTQDFSYDQAHQVFHMHHETVCDQLDAQGLTDGNEQMAGESGLYAMTKGKGKGKGKGGPTFQGTCHHCGKFGHKLVNCPKKDAGMQQFRSTKGQQKGWHGQKGGKGVAKGVWERGAQGLTGGAWSGGKGGGVGLGGKGTYWFDEAPQGPPMLAWSGSETTPTQKKQSGLESGPWFVATVGCACVRKDSCQ